MFWAVREFWAMKSEYYDNTGRIGYPQRRVLLTGHSLGGYLAEVFASNYNLPGVAFQSPGADSANSLHSGRRFGLSPNTGFQILKGEIEPFGNLFSEEPVVPFQPHLYHIAPPIYLEGLWLHSIEATASKLLKADPAWSMTNRNVREYAAVGQRRRRVGLWLATEGTCPGGGPGPCRRSIPQCVDNSTCLQEQHFWFPWHTCENSMKHCEGPWSSDMMHCCPVTCKRERYDTSLADCDGVNTWEHRLFRGTNHPEPWVMHIENHSCFDSDTCLQGKWGAQWTCGKASTYCDEQAPAMLSCCPNTCIKRMPPLGYNDTRGLPCLMQPAGRDVDDDDCYRAGRYREAGGPFDHENNLDWRELSCQLKTGYFVSHCIRALEHKKTDEFFAWPVRAKPGLEVQCCPVACASLLKVAVASKQ